MRFQAGALGFLLLLVGALAETAGEVGKFALEGYVKEGGVGHYAVRFASGPTLWRKIGESISAYKLLRFDEASETLYLGNDTEEIPLVLKKAGIKQSGIVAHEGIHVSRYGEIHVQMSTVADAKLEAVLTALHDAFPDSAVYLNQPAEGSVPTDQMRSLHQAIVRAGFKSIAILSKPSPKK